MEPVILDRFTHFYRSFFNLPQQSFSICYPPGSGDHGVDMLAEKDSITYAIQCRYYSYPSFFIPPGK